MADRANIHQTGFGGGVNQRIQITAFVIVTMHRRIKHAHAIHMVAQCNGVNGAGALDDYRRM